MEAILTSPTHCTRRATGLDTTKLRSTAIRWFIAGGSLLFLTAGLATAAELSGSDLYRLHCASCHGTTGRGDGPDTAIFATPPPDLRTGFLSRYATDELVRRVRDGQPAQLALDPDALRLVPVRWRSWSPICDGCRVSTGHASRRGETSTPRAARAATGCAAMRRRRCRLACGRPVICRIPVFSAASTTRRWRWWCGTGGTACRRSRRG